MDTRRKIREISDDLKRFSSSDPVSVRQSEYCILHGRGLYHCIEFLHIVVLFVLSRGKIVKAI